MTRDTPTPSHPSPTTLNLISLLLGYLRGNVPLPIRQTTIYHNTTTIGHLPPRQSPELLAARSDRRPELGSLYQMERTAKRRKRSARTPRPSCCDSGDSSCDYSWPPSDPSARKLPSNSLLSSLDELLWRAMARINPLDDDTKKLKTCQVRFGTASVIICSAGAKQFSHLLLGLREGSAWNNWLGFRCDE